jgi:hypothetical protein
MALARNQEGTCFLTTTSKYLAQFIDTQSQYGKQYYALGPMENFLAMKDGTT